MSLRALVGITVFILVLVIAWVGGLDFERGSDQAITLVIALIIAAYAACCPYIKD